MPCAVRFALRRKDVQGPVLIDITKDATADATGIYADETGSRI